ncbi:unnamed protein product [Lactuca virosa]|uniref:WAT1-related protein n=1 Tax=Lactuca virosa TaxID=75947 RepID=A0AAU9LUA5_9ASTR|nr:unnamed protein product [Lactuca virosa]
MNSSKKLKVTHTGSFNLLSINIDDKFRSTKRFGPEKERFEHLAFLNLAQSAVCLQWSFVMIKLWGKGKGVRAPWWSYWSAGITNTIGPAMGIEALKYISYPAQVLAKSSKMIPVMLMGSLVYGIRYTFQEYLCSLLVAGGVSIFALAKTSSKTINKLANPNAPLGYGLCFLNLVFDGFTNATQDSISARYPKTNAWDMMLGMNLWGTVYNTVFMFGWPEASGYEAVQFCKHNPEAAWDILYYCLCGAIGQNFIFFTISRFDLPQKEETQENEEKEEACLMKIRSKPHFLVTNSINLSSSAS